MKKLFAIILITLLLSGCSMEYKLNIDKNLIMEEEIVVKEANRVISQFNLNIDSFVDDSIDSYSSDPKYSNYTFERSIDDEFSSGTAKTTYLDFEQFKSKNTLIGYFFNDVSINKDEDIITFDFLSNASNELLGEGNYEEGNKLDSANITITLPFKVLENNADKVLDNSYTWNYSQDNSSKDIHLVFDTSKKSINIKISPGVYVLAGIIAIFAFIGIYIYYRSKKNNVL